MTVKYCIVVRHKEKQGKFFLTSDDNWSENPNVIRLFDTHKQANQYIAAMWFHAPWPLDKEAEGIVVEAESMTIPVNRPKLEVKSVSPSVWGIKWGKNWFAWSYTSEARAKEVMAKLMLREAKGLKVNFSHHTPILKQDVF